jgi:hypothetical protein
MDDGDNVGGHGSHVSGTVLGEADGNEGTLAHSLNEYRGIAPKAKIFFGDIGKDIMMLL